MRIVLLMTEERQQGIAAKQLPLIGHTFITSVPAAVLSCLPVD
jgi:hypothetical protein